MKTTKTCNYPGLTALSAFVFFISLHMAQAQTTYYWDTNGTTAGAGAAPSGTWGVDNFWNTDSAGGSGTFVTNITSADTARFVAGPGAGSGSSSYTVGLSGASISIAALVVNGTTGNTLIGSSVGDGTITIGTGGIAVAGTNVTGVNIRSNINLNGNQTWYSTVVPSGQSFVVSGNVGGTGNLGFGQTNGRGFTISGNVNHTGTLSYNSTASGSGATISGNIGSNVTNVSNSTSQALILSGTNTYSGTTTIAGPNSSTATLRVGSNSALASTTTVTLNTAQAASGATLDLGNGANSFSPTITGLVATSGGTFRQGRAVVTNNSSGTGTGTLTINPTSANTFNGLIRDGTTAKVALSVGGSNTFTLAGVNSYTGGTTVSSGTLAVNANTSTVTNVTVASQASGTGTQTATVASSAGMAIGQAVTASNLAAGTRIIGINGNTLFLSAFATSVGTASGTFDAYQTLGNGAVTASGTGILDLSGSTTTSVGTVTVSGGTIQNGTLTGTSYLTSSGTISANLAGSGIALTQNGSGTTTNLSGTNTYSGATAVSAGTLLISGTGSINSSSGISVGSGAIFRYNSTTALTAPITNSGGSVAGNGNLGSLSLGGTGSVDPGNSPGLMTAGSTDPSSGLDYNLEFTLKNSTPTWASVENDVLRLTGGTPFASALGAGNVLSLYIDAATYASLTNGDFLRGGFYADAGDFLSNVSGATITAYYQDGSGSFTYAGNNYSLLTAGSFGITTVADTNFAGSGYLSQFNYTTIPEPSTYALLVGGLGLLASLRRRTRKAA